MTIITIIGKLLLDKEKNTSGYAIIRKSTVAHQSFHSLDISLFRKVLLKCRTSYRWHLD